MCAMGSNKENPKTVTLRRAGDTFVAWETFLGTDSRLLTIARDV